MFSSPQKPSRSLQDSICTNQLYFSYHRGDSPPLQEFGAQYIETQTSGSNAYLRGTDKRGDDDRHFVNIEINFIGILDN